MSVRMMGLVWDSPLPRDQKFLLLCYADHADHYGESIYPAKTTVERMTGYSRRSVQTITAELVAAGLLVERGISHLQTMSYALNVDLLETLPRGGAQILRGAQKTAQGGRKKQQQGGANSAPYPSGEEPPVKPPVEADLFTEPAIDHPEVPPAMRSPELLAAWGEWKQHRAQKRQKLTPLTVKKQIAQLAQWILLAGPGLAVAAINHSIAHGYMGLFAPKGSQMASPPRTGPITQGTALRMPPRA